MIANALIYFKKKNKIVKISKTIKKEPRTNVKNINATALFAS